MVSHRIRQPGNHDHLRDGRSIGFASPVFTGFAFIERLVDFFLHKSSEPEKHPGSPSDYITYELIIFGNLPVFTGFAFIGFLHDQYSITMLNYPFLFVKLTLHPCKLHNLYLHVIFGQWASTRRMIDRVSHSPLLYKGHRDHQKSEP